MAVNFLVGERDVAFDATVVGDIGAAAGAFAFFKIAEESHQVARGADETTTETAKK